MPTTGPPRHKNDPQPVSAELVSELRGSEEQRLCHDVPPSVLAPVAEAARDGIERFGAGCLIRDGGRILLLRRRKGDCMEGLYELPSGGVEPGESVEEAALRETLEESGLAVTITGYLGSVDYTNSRGQRGRQYAFTATAASISPVILSEHDDFVWAKPDALPNVSDAVRGLIALAEQL
jgi:8-oxo-dGTP diphosphatase